MIKSYNTAVLDLGDARIFVREVALFVDHEGEPPHSGLRAWLKGAELCLEQAERIAKREAEKS